LTYADKSVISELSTAIASEQLLANLERLLYINDELEVYFDDVDTKWFIYQQVVESIATEYQITTNRISKITKAILAAIGGNQTLKISKLWSLFLMTPPELKQLKVMDSDLYYWRDSILKSWNDE